MSPEEEAAKVMYDMIESADLEGGPVLTHLARELAKKGYADSDDCLYDYSHGRRPTKNRSPIRASITHTRSRGGKLPKNALVKVYWCVDVVDADEFWPLDPKKRKELG